MNNKVRFTAPLMLVVYLFMFSACQARTVITPTPINAAVSPTRSVPLSAPKPTLTSPTAPLPSQTPQPVPTQTVSPTPSPAFETVSPLVELIQTNNGCRLPCWWGIEPGSTQWDDARTILLSVAGSENMLELPQGAWVTFDAPPDVTSLAMSLGVDVQNGIVERMAVLFMDRVNAYSIPKVLQAYGKPDEVWIETYSQYADKTPPFSIFIFYRDLGVFIHYQADVTLEGTVIRGCMQSYPGPGNLTLWSPASDLTPQSIFTFAAVDASQPPKRISEATGMTEEDFYQAVKDNNTVCIQTPRDIWPAIMNKAPQP